MKSIQTRALNLTESFQLSRILSKYVDEGDVIALGGELGAGKTTLVSNLSKQMGITNGEHVSSPTYVIHHIYHATYPIHHIDLYRIEHVAQIEHMGFEEIFGRDGIAIIEWFEKFPQIWNGDLLKIQIDLTNLETRTYLFEIFSKKHHERFEKLLRDMNEMFGSSKIS